MSITKWIYSQETESLRVIHTAAKIANGFYRQMSFPIEYYSSKSSNRSVWLPKITYHDFPRFWTKVAKLNITTLPFKVDSKMLNFVKIHLPQLPEPQMHQVKSLWAKHEMAILNHIYQIIPTRIKNIIIHPTYYGTGGSWNVRKTENEALIIYLRADRDLYDLVEAIITSITRYQAIQDLDGNWHETQFLADWLVSKSTLGQLLNKICPQTNHLPTIRYIRLKNLAPSMTVSEKVYQELGLPTANLTIPTLKDLTGQEQKIWALFVQNSGKTVTYDDLAAIMFASDDDFSLEAIVKAIQRLRSKLEANGVTGSLIQTVRSEGYTLNTTQ